MVRKLSVLLVIGLLTFASPAPGAAAGGTLGMRPAGPWAVLLSNAELAAVRGGFFGIAFSVFFQGFFDSLGNAAGQLTVNTGGLTSADGGVTVVPAGTPTVPADFTIQNTQVTISTALGASGILQVNQVPGSFNVVHNSIVINIAIIRLQNSAAISSNLSSLLRPF
ncbi:MAG: hypothetical protein V3S25_00245 [Nitrospirales bacterium]